MFSVKERGRLDPGGIGIPHLASDGSLEEMAERLEWLMMTFGAFVLAANKRRAERGEPSPSEVHAPAERTLVEARQFFTDSSSTLSPRRSGVIAPTSGVLVANGMLLLLTGLVQGLYQKKYSHMGGERKWMVGDF
jgi:hypothetical protein